MRLELSPLNIASTTHKAPIIISGPCAAESEEQILSTAQMLKETGIGIFRAGVWKPRTKPGGFEGIGEPALKWLSDVKNQFGMKTATEVATPEHTELALKYGIDILWIGARTTTNPFAIQAIADSLTGVDMPVLIKNPLNPDIELWIGALERLNSAGIKRLGAIHRGFSSYEQKLYRNIPMWAIPIELHRRYPELPLFCDPSHIGGSRELIAPLSQEAMDLRYDGLFIESHCSPDSALSDASQQITPSQLQRIIASLKIKSKKEQSDFLSEKRELIDDIDDQLMELLSKRMEISRMIGLYKKENNLTVLQTDRYNEIIDKRKKQASLSGMSEEFVKRIFEKIHDESIRQQIEIVI